MRRAFIALVSAISVFLSPDLAIASENGPSPGNGMILTPRPGPTPRVNGPSVFGVRPGSPVLYTIPATGERPIAFSADNLPPGLALDASNGFITGTLKEKGEYRLTLHATNRLGSAHKAFRIIVGDTVALTPPMGWNSWNCWGASVSQEKVLSSARALVEKGLRDHGWSYINIDDGWQGKRGGEFNGIQANPKFPDIAELADDIHRMGLRFGIYSTPWNVTYAGHIGSYADHEDGSYTWISSRQHNENFKINRNGNKPDDVGKKEAINGAHSFVINDVSQWAAWGVDFLKYDWYVIDVPRVKEMHDALAAAPRDIVYSLSNSAPFEEAAEFARYSNLWRTTGDIEDSWKSMSTIGFNQDRWAPYSGPGHWNDPDMLIVGQVGWGSPQPTTLTPDEQYTHISLWSLLAAPLLIGCDLSTLDDFTLSLLTNDEVIEVNQDPLGKQGICVAKDGDLRVYAKPLEDGSLAVGLFNLGAQNAEVSTSWADLKISGRQRVRNLWTQKDIGTYENCFRSSVASHGVVFLRLFPEE